MNLPESDDDDFRILKGALKIIGCLMLGFVLLIVFYLLLGGYVPLGPVA
jgi:hypothetical protein